MPTDKSINFSTKPICPECGREISTDEIDVEKDRAWCPNCHREMSFVEVADYSLVQAKRNKPLPPGFSIISDSEDSLVISFKSARIGLRLFGLLFSILLAIFFKSTVFPAFGPCCRRVPLCTHGIGDLGLAVSAKRVETAHGLQVLSWTLFRRNPTDFFQAACP